jgi:hypothetical protein
MTDKHKAAIRRGIKRAQKRRHLSVAMLKSWQRRRSADTVKSDNHVTPEQFKNDVTDHMVSRITDLLEENRRYRELFAKLQNTLK